MSKVIGSALEVKGPITVNGVTVVDASGNVDAPVTTTDLTTTGNTTLGNAVSDTTAINGATTITTTSASGLTVGANGATNPVLKVNANTASVATGITVVGAAAAGGVAVSAISSGTNENLTIDAKGSGTVTVAGTSTGSISLARSTSVTGAATVTSAGANALAVGLNGATNPAFNVDASTASSATGINVKSAAAAGGVAVSVVSSGTNENLTLDAKGSGTVTIAGTSTGNVVVPRTFAQGTDATDRVAVKGIYMSPANVAVTVPAITDPDIAKVDVDVSGAFSMQPAVGDAVIAIPQEAMETNARVMSAYVTATDTVTVVFGSEGGNVTGGAKNFKFLVIDLT